MKSYLGLVIALMSSSAYEQIDASLYNVTIELMVHSEVWDDLYSYSNWREESNHLSPLPVTDPCLVNEILVSHVNLFQVEAMDVLEIFCS